MRFLRYTLPKLMGEYSPSALYLAQIDGQVFAFCVTSLSAPGGGALGNRLTRGALCLPIGKGAFFAEVH